MPDNVSPLARRLADTHAVDLATLEKGGPDDKITARSVLEYLSASGEAVKRRAPGKLDDTARPQPDAPVVTAEALESAPVQPPPPERDPALEQTRAQLQATAQVHQQALMQVGALREQNSLLGDELERLRAAEAQARSEIQALEAQKRQLQAELERPRNGVLAWLRKFAF